jgi:mitosis inhibitor protein kinase SWE1
VPFSGTQGPRTSFPCQFPEAPQPGRFERDFVQIDEVGSGEFGEVIKVQVKGGNEHEIFAIKKSKMFEGVKHRCVPRSKFAFFVDDD